MKEILAYHLMLKNPSEIVPLRDARTRIKDLRAPPYCDHILETQHEMRMEAHKQCHHAEIAAPPLY